MTDNLARLIAAIHKVLDNVAAYSSAWEVDLFSDGIELYNELKAALDAVEDENR